MCETVQQVLLKQHMTRRYPRSRIRRHQRRASLSFLIGCVLTVHYITSRRILRDRKVTRLFPRVLNELCRDLCVNWGQRIALLREEPTFTAFGDVQVAVLTLRRKSERAAPLRKQLDREGITFRSVDAVDGQAEFMEEEVRTYAGPRRRKLILNVHKSATIREKQERARFACLLTHVRIWQQLVSSSLTYRVVLEDDVTIVHNFRVKLLRALNAMPKTWDILYLNATEPRYGSQVRQGLYQSKGALGTFGYAISQQGAEKLLKFAQNCDKPVDHMIDTATIKGKINAFHSFPPLVRHNDYLRSTIQSTGYL